MALALVTLAAGCGQSDGSLLGAGETWPEAVQNKEDAARRASVIRSRQRQAGAAYAFAQRGLGTLYARNPVHGFVVEMDERGVRVSRTPWSFWLRLARFGRQSGLERVGARPPRPAAANGHRASVQHGASLEEWYENGPLGLEQGFSVERAPAGAGPLLFELEVSGDLEPALDVDARRIELRDAAGEVAAYYSDLWARDACGESLPVQMRLHQGSVRLVVDDRAASYPIEVDPLIWLELQKLLASDGEGGDEFGGAVSLNGGTALVGACWDDSARGAAYVFARDATTWSQQDKLTASDGVPWDGFGWAVSLSGDTALVSAIREADDDLDSAYVFVRVGNGWSELQKLTASDGEPNDSFGNSVSLSGETALIGTPYDDDNDLPQSGSAYVFVRDATSWSEQSKLTASDGAESDEFGVAVSLNDETALIGARSDDDDDYNNSGSAYVFVREATSWSEQSKLTAGDGRANDGFGIAVSLGGETALVGAEWDDDNGPDSGSAYVFVREATSWSEQEKLSAPDGWEEDHFGQAVSLSGEMALVGAYLDDLGWTRQDRGSAYVFKRDGTSWSPHGKLTASDGAQQDRFGIAVSLSGHTALVGADQAHSDDDPGSAYVFSWGGENGDLCSVPNDCANGHCVDGFCCDRACDGECEACAAALKDWGEDGLCGPVPAGSEPPSGHGECDIDPNYPSSCGADGLCDGQGDCRSHAPASVECAPPSCDEDTDVKTLAARCDGEGNCVAQGTAPCAPYACSGDDCKTSCGDDADCVSGYECNESSDQCVAMPICYENILVQPDGEHCDCWPYHCEQGACLESCQSAADCVKPYQCTSNGKCEDAQNPVEVDSGCGCAVPGRSPGRQAGLLVALLALCCASRRPRRQRGRARG